MTFKMILISSINIFVETLRLILISQILTKKLFNKIAKKLKIQQNAKQSHENPFAHLMNTFFKYTFTIFKHNIILMGNLEMRNMTTTAPGIFVIDSFPCEPNTPWCKMMTSIFNCFIIGYILFILLRTTKKMIMLLDINTSNYVASSLF